MENPVLYFKHRKWEIILFEIAYLISLLFCLGIAINGAMKKDGFLCVYGFVMFLICFLFFRFYRGDIRGYIAVYSNKIIEKKKHTKEVVLNDVIEIRYFKKRIAVKGIISYMDCLQFFVKDQKVPILISPSFKGTAVPHNMRGETTAILAYIWANFPSIKYTKEQWKGTY